MKIAIDARWIFPEISGIGAYTRSLVRELLALDGTNQYVLLFDNAEVAARTRAETGADAAANADCALLPYGVFSLANQAFLGCWLRRHRVDVFHSTNYMIPLFAFPRHRRGRVGCVVTIHDVIPLLFPDSAPLSRKSRMFALYRWVMRQVGARADAIVTDSRASERDVVEQLAIGRARRGKVHTVHCGVAVPAAGAAASIPNVPEGCDHTQIVLYVGRLDPYKNVPLLVHAFARLRAVCPVPTRLVIAGSRDPRYPQAEDEARKLGVAEHVSWTGYLSDAELDALYRRAAVLAHPSRYEGFGLQVVEAMARGTPVVCCDGGAQAEVAGEAAVVVPCDDTEAMAAALKRVLTESDLAASLRQAGLERAKSFTWRRAAEQTLAIYREVGRHA
jgi:glycosyltransferase involved in cell wall biosynthesis